MPSKAMLKAKKETEAIVLDYLQCGRENDKRPITQRDPLVVAIGTNWFKLIELIPQKDKFVEPKHKVSLENPNPFIKRVNRRIYYRDLTDIAKDELEPAIMRIITDNNARFIEFYNNAGYFTLTKHMLSLLPGFTPAMLKSFLAERQKKPFESFADMKARVKSMKTPEKYICSRVIMELTNHQKQLLFTTR